MKIDFKNPNVYYIGVPVLAGLWAILAGFVFYPSSIEVWDKSRTDFESVEKQIKQLVALQPKRLAYKVDEKAEPEDFDFTKTINEFARIFSISDSNYNLTVRGQTKRAGRQTRSATIVIKTIDIEKRLHIRKKPLHFLGTFFVGMASRSFFPRCCSAGRN